MQRWTEEQVVALAPDERSVAAARKLARPGPWSETGSTDTLVWGKCQGSGSTPYQVTVDLTGPAARCTCPSRKFPCKHGLALLLLWVAGEGSVADAAEPADVAADWADGRRERRTRARTEEASTPDPVAQAKRREERLALMTAGADDFARWLRDLVRGGLAAARHQPYGFWDGAAARLVDSQLPGLAERVRGMGSAVAARADWADHLLTEAGRWWCACAAWNRRDELDAAELGDLRAFVGWAVPTEEVRRLGATAGTWLVLGVHRTDDGRLQQQRTWLRDRDTGETVLVLDFAAVGGSLGVAKVVGTELQATVARYPGSGVQRALFVDEPEVRGTTSDVPGARSFDEELAGAAERWAANPWLDRVPIAVAGVTVSVGDAGTHLVDATGASLPLDALAVPWPALARTGGRPVDVFGELDGGRVRPLTYALDGELVAW